MKSKWVSSTLFFLIIISPSRILSQIIPFDSERWKIQANESSIVDYLGRQSLFIKGGNAVVEDSDFKNGVIEFDIAFTGERGFMGVAWRMYDTDNFEEFYLRPHQTGKPDANQYTPIFNGLAAWQLYHGDGYGAPADYFFNEWMHVKVIVSGNRAEVYIKDMEKPAVAIHELKHGVISGKVGLTCANLAPAYFSNFKFTHQDAPRLRSQAYHPKPAPIGSIMKWQVSNTFDEKILDKKYLLKSSDKKAFTWRELTGENSGITNLSRLHKVNDGNNTVFVRASIISDVEQVKKFKFGYSDRIKVYFDNRLYYGGNNNYQSRDFRYLGTIGYFDEVFLPLKRGENEILLAVSENFGGWGIKAAFEDMSGIRFE